MSIESLNKNADAKALKDKYSNIIEEIILPTEEDLQIIKEIEKYLFSLDKRSFNENNQNFQNIIFFLKAFQEFLKSSIIIYKTKNHKQRRKWLMSLPLEERNFFDNNRLRINKIFSLLLALDLLITEEENNSLQQYSSWFNNLWSEFDSKIYNTLDDQTKIKLVNKLKEFCLQIFTEIKKSFKIN